MSPYVSSQPSLIFPSASPRFFERICRRDSSLSLPETYRSGPTLLTFLPSFGSPRVSLRTDVVSGRNRRNFSLLGLLLGNGHQDWVGNGDERDHEGSITGDEDGEVKDERRRRYSESEREKKDIGREKG